MTEPDFNCMFYGKKYLRRKVRHLIDPERDFYSTLKILRRSHPSDPFRIHMLAFWIRLLYEVCEDQEKRIKRLEKKDD